MSAEQQRDPAPRRAANGPEPGRPEQRSAEQGNPPRPPAPAKRSRWTDLDLNGSVPPRATPMLGDWGPEGVPSTGEKARQRWLVPVVFGVMVLVVAFTWHYFWVRLG